MALGRDAGLLWVALVWLGCIWAGPSYPSIHLSTYLSIPEVPTPLGLLSPLSGIGISSLGISRYLGRALVAREVYGRLPLFD